MTFARFGDPTALRAPAARVFTGDESQVRHQLARSTKASPLGV
jgi:hypothetical protein